MAMRCAERIALYVSGIIRLELGWLYSDQFVDTRGGGGMKGGRNWGVTSSKRSAGGRTVPVVCRRWKYGGIVEYVGG